MTNYIINMTMHKKYTKCDVDDVISSMRSLTERESDSHSHIHIFISNMKNHIKPLICTYHAIKYYLKKDKMCCTNMSLFDSLILTSSLIPAFAKDMWSCYNSYFSSCKDGCTNAQHKLQIVKMIILLSALCQSNDTMLMNDFTKLLPHTNILTPHDAWTKCNMDNIISHILIKEDHKVCNCVHILRSHMESKYPQFYGLFECDETILDIIFNNDTFKLQQIVKLDDIFLLTRDKFVPTQISNILNFDNYFDLVAMLSDTDNYTCKQHQISTNRTYKVIEIGKLNPYPKCVYFINGKLIRDESSIPGTYANKFTILQKVMLVSQCQEYPRSIYNKHIICVNCASYGYVIDCPLRTLSRIIKPRATSYIYYYLIHTCAILSLTPLIFDIKKIILTTLHSLALHKFSSTNIFY